jgi:hypothetical protein
LTGDDQDSPAAAAPAPGFGSQPAASPVLPDPLASEASPESPLWLWFAAVAGLLLVLLGGAMLVRRRREPRPAHVPTIEPPLLQPRSPVAPAMPSSTFPQPDFGASLASAPRPSAPVSSLRIEATPSHLTRSLMAATFTCRVALVNRGDTVLEDITVELDMVTAHGSVPTSEQLADPARPLQEAGRIARIAPGERVDFAREVRLATADIRTLSQGKAQLFVPLLRVRAQAAGHSPVARTFIVGTLPEEGAKKLQPFRLDEMPQTYRAIGVAALD